jgi:hypothetical protein
MARNLRRPEPHSRESLSLVLTYIYDRSTTGEALAVAAKKMIIALLMTCISDLNALIGRTALLMLCYVNLVTCGITAFLLFLKKYACIIIITITTIICKRALYEP